MLTSDDFTSSETIDGFQPGDHTIEIVGYVGGIETNLHIKKSESKFEKFICCNGSGKRVQVTDWKKNISKLKDIKLGHIVHANSMKYNQPPESRYNSGNVPFELIIDDNSEVSVYGIMSELAAEEVSILEAYRKIGKKINAVIKTEPGIHKNKDFISTVASVINTVEELELKINFDYKQLEKLLKIGYSVVVPGILERYSPGPPLLRIDSAEDVEFLERPRLSFIEVRNGFRVRELEE